MDPANTFESPGTYSALRSEYGLLALGSTYLLWRNRKKVRWPIAGALFYYNDVIGYIPGAIAYRRSKDKKISKAYYALYNVMHSAITGATVAALWARFVRPEWALLGIPIHIGIDRGLFGNFLKPFSVPFEPEPHPAWEEAKPKLSQPWQQVEVPSANGAGAAETPASAA